MEHVIYECTGCKSAYCLFCDGGLALCTVCGGGEGGLATECPGSRLAPAQQDQILAGQLDYINGAWVSKVGPTSETIQRPTGALDADRPTA